MKELHSKSAIQNRIQEIAVQINADYAGQKVLLVSVLKGASVFLAHLLLELKIDCEIDFMTVSSYKHGTESSDFKLVQDLDTDVAGKQILLVEDIIDSGKTARFVLDYLAARGAAGVEIVTLIEKETRRQVSVPKPKYIGFEYSAEPFLVGFGLDYAERWRNLPAIFQMEEADFE